MTIQLTIIGLGQIGASMGLALAGEKHQLVRIGHDRSPETARRAERMGAVDKVQGNLHASVENADIVVLAIPVDEIRETMEQIAPDLKSEVVVIDTSSVKVPVAEWAKELFPPDRYFISLTPSVNPKYLLDPARGIDAAHEDLFHKSLIVITSPTGVDPSAVRLGSDLISLLGAEPFFADPYESDGLIAAGRMLPQVAAAALVNATIDQPGWLEGRKLAGQAYAQTTRPVENMEDTFRLGQALLLNRENVMRVIDDLTGSLNELRQALAESDEDALHKLLNHAQEGRSTWLIQREKADWDQTIKQPEMPSTRDVMGRFFGFRRQKKEEENKKQDRKKK